MHPIDKELREKMIRELAARFGASAFTVGTPPEPDIVFPAAHPDVGRAQIWIEHGEAIVAVEHITHGHFADYRENVTDGERDDQIATDVSNFLADLFAGRVILYGSAKAGGGWTYGDDRPDPRRIFALAHPTYLWTGPPPVDDAEGVTP